MNRFKSASAHSVRLYHGKGKTIWQKGFFDHAARSDEDLLTIARYIIANPLRAGLCESVGDYPWWDAEWL